MLHGDIYLACTGADTKESRSAGVCVQDQTTIDQPMIVELTYLAQEVNVYIVCVYIPYKH